MSWRTFCAGASIYVLVSTMGHGLRPEDAVDWVDAVLRALAAFYFAVWLDGIVGKAGQG
jgi:hypothetical protein